MRRIVPWFMLSFPFSFVTPIMASPGEIILVSASDSGEKGNGSSENPALPAAGDKVAFRSAATNLDPADTDSQYDEYVKDLSSGDLTLISTSDGGVKSNGFCANPVFSADGSRVAFRSGATNLDPIDTDTKFDIFVKHLATGNITVASTNDAGEKANRGSYNPFLSADGARVAFRSYATNLDPADPDARLDVYVKNLLTGNIVLASTSATGVKGNGGSGNPALSANGSMVTFYSTATNLHPADNDPVSDIYLKDVGTRDIRLISVSEAGTKGNGPSILPYMTPEASRVVFISAAANLDPADTDRMQDVYLKDIASGELTLVSITEDGTKGNGKSLSAILSADGTKVAFTSESTNLDPADTDPLADVYVKDLQTGDITLASTNAMGEKANGEGINPALTADGSSVAFYSSATNISSQDRDPLFDVYLKEIDPVADLALNMSDAPDPVKVGQRLSYFLTVTNAGPSSASRISVIDGLPADTSFVSATSHQGTCERDHRRVICDLGRLAMGQSVRVVVVVTPKRPGTVTNVATVNGLEPDDDSGNDADAESTTVVNG